jgi:hypothetical protein
MLFAAIRSMRLERNTARLPRTHSPLSAGSLLAALLQMDSLVVLPCHQRMFLIFWIQKQPERMVVTYFFQTVELLLLNFLLTSFHKGQQILLVWWPLRLECAPAMEHSILFPETVSRSE